MVKNKKQTLVNSAIIVFLTVVLLCVLFFKQLSHAAWIEDENGMKYQHLDGQYAVGFIDIEEQRYFFDENGYLVKGKFYVTEEGAYYYSNEEGIVQYGVIQQEDNFYITEEDGKLKIGFVELDNKRYFFNDAAQLVTGWFKYETNWYYADHTGVIMTGFLELDGYRYYLNADGTRVSDAVLTIDGITYVFNKDGSIDENATTLYPVFQYLNQVRVDNGLSDLLLNSKVQACAILRASELKNGFQIGITEGMEDLLRNHGVMCAGGYEFAYGGIEGYDIARLVQDMQKDINIQRILQDDSVAEVGLGVYIEDGILYYDIIFIY